MSEHLNEFYEIWSATTSSEIDKVLLQLGNNIEWVPLGNNPGNYGIIRITADPFDGITERITNAIDAIIELDVELHPELKNCKSPRDAIEKIFGFKEGNLRYCEEQIGDLASRIKVSFQDSEIPKKPTIEILDRGIGQHPIDFPDTLLGLNSNYKVKKLYLIGAFGQGGQTSFSHSRYGIIISRKNPKLLKEGQEDIIGWSIVRYNDPSSRDDIWKNGLWEYCIDVKTKRVLSINPKELKMVFDHGTLIRLICYEMKGGTSDVLQPASTAWSFLSQSLFDPLLPIRLGEERSEFDKRSRPLSGLARRLWHGGKGEKVKISISDSYLLDLGMKGQIRINYWGLVPTDELENWRDIKKGFVSQNQAFFITLNGQKHYSESSTEFLRDRLELSYSYDYIIIQVDCDRLTTQAKKDLLTTTRDRLIESEFKDEFIEEIAQHLRQDRNIMAFEQERKKKLLSVKSERDTSRIRQMVGKYIASNPLLNDLISSRSKEKIKGEKEKKTKDEEETKDDIRDEELEIPILKELPTYLRIANSKNPIPIEKGGNALIRLETDAFDSYFEGELEKHFKIYHKSGIFNRRSCSGLRNGKISYYIHCLSSIRVGSKEEIRFELDLPDGKMLSVERTIICIAPHIRVKEPGKQKLPEPKIIPVSNEMNPGLWAQFGWSEKSVGKVIMDKKDESGIYISLDNEFLIRAKNNKKFNQEIIRSIEERYVAGIAYYLLLKKADELNHKTKSEDKGNGLEDESRELERLAQTIAALSLPIERI